MRKLFRSILRFFVRGTILAQDLIPIEERLRLVRLHENMWKEEKEGSEL